MTARRDLRKATNRYMAEMDAMTLPEYQQLNVSGALGSGGQDLAALYQQLGVAAPVDTRASQYQSLNNQFSNALSAIGERGLRGGVATGQGGAVGAQMYAPAAASIENQYAQQLANYDQQRLAGAMGIGQQHLGAQQYSNQLANMDYQNQLAQLQAKYGAASNAASQQMAANQAWGGAIMGMAGDVVSGGMGLVK